jgi:uncharacterized protein with PQ loop repeat
MDVGSFCTFAGLWLAQFFYFIGFIPQLITNYQIKSGKGLSDLFLLAYFNAYATLLFYIFCLDLPTAYKIFVPIESVAVVILIFQRLYYDRSARSKWLCVMYSLNTLLMLAIIPAALLYPHSIGHAGGWINTVIFGVSLVPQVLKIHYEKSVEGFSFFFVLLIGIAGIIECAASFICGLPFQTTISAFRVIVFFIILCIQFLMYDRPIKNNAKPR